MRLVTTISLLCALASPTLVGARGTAADAASAPRAVNAGTDGPADQDTVSGIGQLARGVYVMQEDDGPITLVFAPADRFVADAR